MKTRRMTQKKKDIIKSLAINKSDVGSAEIQIGLLSNKIEKLAIHFKKYKKDKHSTIGLSKSVNKRKKLLSYLKRKKPDSYEKIIKQLSLRK
jgi:small subunit ribosomal protein S15